MGTFKTDKPGGAVTQFGPSAASVPLSRYAAVIRYIQHLLLTHIVLYYLKLESKRIKRRTESNPARVKSAITSKAGVAYQRPLLSCRFPLQAHCLVNTRRYQLYLSRSCCVIVWALRDISCTWLLCW